MLAQDSTHFDEPHTRDGNSDPGEIEAKWKESVRDKFSLEDLENIERLVHTRRERVRQLTRLRGIERFTVGAIPCTEQKSILADMEMKQTIAGFDSRYLVWHEIVLG